MDDVDVLTARNEHFIDACRQGSWERLRMIVGSDFRYLDGRTGERWDQDRYVTDLRDHPSPTLTIDQVAIQIAGDTATVSARTSSQVTQSSGRRSRRSGLTATQPQDGSQVSMCSRSIVIGSPLRIGHSQMKLATTSPT